MVKSVALMSSTGYAISHNLTPFISMQNHHSLLYREEEREMLPLLKVNLCSHLRVKVCSGHSMFDFIISTSASGASRGVPWREVYSLGHGMRPARAVRRIGERPILSTKTLEPDPLQLDWNVQRQKCVRGDRAAVRNVTLYPPPSDRYLLFFSVLRSWRRRRG